eukprot:gb/GECH01011740.1/.p1 GENE.gb/GECH01011740.1/~~gb/GECH01011740.1/.p1  ORF type:complete len:346 (+),score=104.75 gb/GECH01011740.1/:1-1038(+)
MTKGYLLGMGNPLLDISANVKEEFLEKHGVKHSLGTAIMAEEKHLPIYDDLKDNCDPEFIAGGATQNTIRVAQWMMSGAGKTAYIGCIGDDEFGKKLEAAAAKDGVDTFYKKDPKVSTGTCAVCVVGTERGLIANLAAANNYSYDHLCQESIQKDVIDKTDMFYIGGFFLTVSPESITHVGKHAAENNKPFMMNTSALFIVQAFKDRFLAALPYTDYLFGNHEEALALAETLELGTKDLKEIAKKIAKYDKVNDKRPRTVVITQGEEPVIISVGGEDAKSYEVPVVPKEKLVDTNGAGDAFVGGFLSQLYQGQPIDTCVKAGNYAASVIIQRSGCTFPDKPEFSA